MKNYEVWVVYDIMGVAQGCFLKCEEQLARSMARMISGSCKLVIMSSDVLSYLKNNIKKVK